MERALQTPHCGLVLAWQGQLAQRTLRRLQLAAVTGKAMGVLFMRNNSEHSPSSMKLEIESLTENDHQYLDINILKARGSFKPSSLRLQLRDLPGTPLGTPDADRQENRDEDRERGCEERPMGKSKPSEGKPSEVVGDA
jgi:hypothetical protein